MSTGLENLDVLALALDPTTPTTLYAGTLRRRRLQDHGRGRELGEHGAEWRSCVAALALDPTTPTTVYAGTSQGVFKTTDGGGSWSPMNTGLRCAVLTSCDVLALALDPTTPTTLYAGTDA